MRKMCADQGEASPVTVAAIAITAGRRRQSPSWIVAASMPRRQSRPLARPRHRLKSHLSPRISKDRAAMTGLIMTNSIYPTPPCPGIPSAPGITSATSCRRRDYWAAPMARGILSTSTSSRRRTIGVRWKTPTTTAMDIIDQFYDIHCCGRQMENADDHSNGYHRIGLWECLMGCRHRLDQQIARRKVEQGLKLYRAHKQQAAVRKWRGALANIGRKEDKFALLGYLYQAYMDWGKYRDSVDFGHRQLCISEELDSPNMRAEAYLNLARAHERLGALDRALGFARHSLYNECDQCATAGLVHLTVGRVHLELAGFCKALEAFQRAHKIAHSIQDPSLELQVYVGLSELFCRLQDADKSARYAARAYDLSRSLQLGDLNSRHHRAALLQMAAALRKKGELGDAHDYCSEATRLSLVSGDQASYARSIRIMGDIYRRKSEISKAFRQYESAMTSAAATGDRLCQMEAMDGAARCLEALRLQHKICNCKPLEFNTRLHEVASSVGAKLLMKTVRGRLSRIYGSLGDEDQKAHFERAAASLEEDLELRCGGCGEPFGLEPDSLEALPCSHILHARCAYDILKKRDKKKKRLCPDCHKSVSSRLYLHCDDSHDINPLNHSSLSLASLRASSLATLEDCHATSSV